jgi:hypothetical protein
VYASATNADIQAILDAIATLLSIDVARINIREARSGSTILEG